MGRTVGGLPMYVLTITNNTGQYINNQLNKKKKKVIYITARTHAGETHGSVVMQHLMHELCLSFNNEKNKYDILL
jgi:hypothetical protein